MANKDLNLLQNDERTLAYCAPDNIDSMHKASASGIEICSKFP
jgi:hypothetical protein